MILNEMNLLELKTPAAPETNGRQNVFAPEYMPLLQSVFLSPDDHPSHGGVVAFAKADGKCDLNSIVKILAEQLADFTDNRILVADIFSLQRLRNNDAIDAPRICQTRENSRVWILTDNDELCADQDDNDVLFGRLWENNLNYGSNPLQQLRRSFDFILVECQEMQHVGIVAPLVDGVVVVVAANRTKRGQIQRAQQMIEVTGGKLLGFILDRYRYPLPKWLYRWL